MSVSRLASSLLVPFGVALGQGPDTADIKSEQLEARLHYQTGKVVVGNGLATLNLPATFRYLNPKETDLVLTAWGNPLSTMRTGTSTTLTPPRSTTRSGRRLAQAVVRSQGRTSPAATSVDTHKKSGRRACAPPAKSRAATLA